MQPQVSKVEIKLLAQQMKQDMIIKKRLMREKKEKTLKGGYELVYPCISYAEEEKIKERVAILTSNGH